MNGDQQQQQSSESHPKVETDVAEDILKLVSRGRGADEGSRVTAADLFGSSSEEEDEKEEVEVIPKKRVSSVSRRATEYRAEYSDGYDEELYGDEEDRQKLLGMTEIDREAVLYERAQARLARAERKALERKVRDLELQEQAAAQAKRKGPLDKKRQTLDALKAAREKKKRRRATGAASPDDSDDVFIGSDGEEEGQIDEESMDDDEDESQYSEEEEPQPKSQLKKKQPITIEPVDFELINKAQLTRNSIAQWIYHPDFDDLARGSFVRLAIGAAKDGEQVYRLVEIKKVTKYYRNYRIGNLAVNKGALLKYGKSERTFRLDIISNSPFTEKEFQRWKAVLTDEGQLIPSKKAVQVKADAWKAFLEQPVSDEVVQAMVAAKKEVGNAHRNLIAERTVLLNQRAEAESSGNLEECEQIDRELASISQEIEQSQSKRQGSDRLEALAEINKRNRQLNVSIAREAEKLSANHKSGTGKMDPFSRRKCQPTNFHDFGPEDTHQNELVPEEAQKPDEPRLAAPATTNRKVDLFAVHDVDIDIDL